jgi:hypothetical protein
MSPSDLPPLAPLTLDDRVKQVEQLWKELQAQEGGGPPAKPPSKRSIDEQMAAYEEHLKETDWGHQPC